MRALSLLLSVTAGAASALAILACGETNQISPDVAEHAITQGLAQKGLEVTSVACPAGHPARAGEKLTCTAVTKAGDTVAIDVDVLDETGRVSWELRGVVVHEKLMAEGISAKTAGAIQVKCPDKVIVVPVGGSFVCEAGSGGSLTQHMRITITDHEGNETWQLVP